MERKVIKQGNDTLTITLPRDWTRKYNIKGGDALNFKIKEDFLEIHGKNKGYQQPINFNIDFDDDTLLKWTLGSLYRIGFEEVHLTYANPLIFNKIQKLIKDTFVGFIIIDQNKNSCVIKSMTSDDSNNIPALMNRGFLVVLSFAENCHDVLKKNQFNRLNSLLYLHENSDQLIRLCQRLIIKNSYKDVANASFNVALLENLEILCDEYKDICKFFTKRHKPFKRHGEIIGLLDSLNKILERVSHLIFAHKNEEIIDLVQEIEKNNNKINLLCSSKNKDEIIFLFYLKSISDLIRNFFPTITIMHVNKLNTQSP